VSGVIVPILPMRDFDFSFLTGGASRTIHLHRALMCAPFYYATLELRVHDHNLGSGQSVKLQGWATNPSSEDPQEFTETSTSWEISVTSAISAPYLARYSITDVPTYVKILLKFTQGSSTGTALYARISAGLTLREA